MAKTQMIHDAAVAVLVPELAKHRGSYKRLIGQTRIVWVDIGLGYGPEQIEVTISREILAEAIRSHQVIPPGGAGNGRARK